MQLMHLSPSNYIFEQVDALFSGSIAVSCQCFSVLIPVCGLAAFSLASVSVPVAVLSLRLSLCQCHCH